MKSLKTILHLRNTQITVAQFPQVLTGLGFEPGSLPMTRLNEEDHWNFNITCSTGNGFKSNSV